MSLSLHLYRLVAAVTPTPNPPPGGPKTVAPAAPIRVKVGEVGEWFGPTAVLAVALILDATAAGSGAKRDRVAAALTYCATLGYISIYGWSDDVQGWFAGSWSMKLTGSIISFLAHAALIAIMIGDGSKWTKRINGWLGPRVGIGSADGEAVGKLNTKLHMAAAVAAMTYVLARGDAAVVPHTIGDTLTGASAVAVGWMIERLGG
jgi:hypothetical protein